MPAARQGGSRRRGGVRHGIARRRTFAIRGFGSCQPRPRHFPRRVPEGFQKGSRRVPEGLDVRSKIPLRGCKSPLLLTFLWKIDRKTGGGERSPATGNCRREKSCLTDGIGLTCGLGCSACSLIPKVSGFRSFPTVRNVRKVFGTGQQVRASRLMLPDARFPTLAPRCVRSVDGSESSVARRGGVRKNLVATIHPRNNPTVAS